MLHKLTHCLRWTGVSGMAAIMVVVKDGPIRGKVIIVLEQIKVITMT